MKRHIDKAKNLVGDKLRQIKDAGVEAAKKVSDKENINRTVLNLRSKGDQRLTIMVIPHGERKIFNFQLSLAMVMFAITICLAILTMSVIGILNFQKVDDDLGKLSAIDYGNLSEVDTFKKAREELTELENEIHSNHKAILKIIESNENEYELYKQVEHLEELTQAQIYSEEKKSDVGYIDEVYEFRLLQTKLKRELFALDTITRFVGERAYISRNTPYAWPAYGRVSSGYGIRASPTNQSKYEHHPGLDIAATTGTPIYAPADGTVTTAVVSYAKRGYGTHLIIKHNYGFSTLYGHCNRLFVRKGDTVRKGQKIAAIGNTGRSTGPHLHYEVRFGDNRARHNPAEYLPGL